jgi:hypothetical protein
VPPGASDDSSWKILSKKSVTSLVPDGTVSLLPPFFAPLMSPLGASPLTIILEPSPSSERFASSIASRSFVSTKRAVDLYINFD